MSVVKTFVEMQAHFVEHPSCCDGGRAGMCAEGDRLYAAHLAEMRRTIERIGNRESGGSVPNPDPNGAPFLRPALASGRAESPLLNKSGGTYGRAQTDTICAACGSGRGVACAADCPRRSPTLNRSGDTPRCHCGDPDCKAFPIDQPIGPLNKGPV